MIFQQALMSSLHAHACNIAIEYNNEKIRYEELAAMADRVARALLARQLAPETIVGVQVTDKVQQIACMIGILQARCTFVPLDPAMPEKRFELINNDLQLEWMIISEDATVRADIRQLPVRQLLQTDNNDTFTYPAYEEDDSIYVYFTSGSTGVPKGVIGRNKSLLQFIQWEISTFNLDANCRISQFISPYFDAFLRDVFVPLLAGGTLCIPPNEKDLFTTEKLTDWIDQSAVTLVHCVPSVFRIFNSTTITPAHFSRLQYVLLSGEKINPAELGNWYQAFHDRIQLVNLYGATETTMIRAYYLIRPEDVKSNRIPVGKPIADTALLVMNKEMGICANLIVGDLYIVSDYISKGYLNNPALTNEVFTIIDTPGMGPKTAYKTGDRARMLADGNIDLIGREDRQVKLRGIRIELDEIERVIARSGIVKSVAVIIHTEKNREESLIAYIIPVADTDKTAVETVYQHVNSHLPAYMIPARILTVPEFPLLSNGKINYKGFRPEEYAVEVVVPANETETALLAIWKEILGDRTISTTESSLRSGGNSLSIMRLVGRIFNDFKVRIPLSDIFHNLTIRQQATLIEQAGKSNLYIIQETAARQYYKTSSVQKRIYFNYELNKGRTSYNLPMAWEFNGSLDPAVIKQIFSQLIIKHEVLRTRFLMKEEELVQEIVPHGDFHLELLREQNGNLESLIDEFIRPFDLSAAPLIRATVIKTERGVDLLLADLHHIICDGMSQNILRTDFETLYAGRELTPLATQYKDYAAWEHHFRETEDFISQRAFWLQRFDREVPRLNLPSIGADTEDLSDRGGNIFFQIPREQLKPLVDHLYNEELTQFIGIFSMYFIFISQLSGQEDIVVGVTSSGRTQMELENVVGMFVKVLPIRYQIDPESSFKRLIGSLHQYMTQAVNNQFFDLADILIALNNNRPAPIMSLFDVAFVYGNFEHLREEDVIQNPAFSPYVFENKNSKFPITLYVGEDEASFNFRLEYSRAYFHPADARHLADQFKALAIKLAGEPNKSLGELLRNTAVDSDLVDEDIQFKF